MNSSKEEVGSTPISFSPTVHRIEVLDALRGFALLGILIINSMAIFSVKTPLDPGQTIAEKSLQIAILILIQSKFVALFSLLFGIGFSIQFANAKRHAKNFLPRITRRMTALFAFGALHITLLWDGDILILYAITGMILILLRNISDHLLKKCVGYLIGLPTLCLTLLFVVAAVFRVFGGEPSAPHEAGSSGASDMSGSGEIYQLARASYLAGVGIRINSYLGNAMSPFAFTEIGTVLAMFLIGLYIGRGRFLSTLTDQREILEKVKGICFTYGLLLNLALATGAIFLPSKFALISLLLIPFFAGPMLAIGIASAFTCRYLNSPKSIVFSVFATTGRMALSNYIGQSLMLTYLAYGWGLDLATKLNGFQVLTISLFLYGVQYLLSRWWLSAFRFGPLEWIWRSITYWNRFPMRREIVPSEPIRL